MPYLINKGLKFSAVKWLIIQTKKQDTGKHAQKSSIVLYDNSFAIKHQLQVEIDKLTKQIRQ